MESERAVERRSRLGALLDHKVTVAVGLGCTAWTAGEIIRSVFGWTVAVMDALPAQVTWVVGTAGVMLLGGHVYVKWWGRISRAVVSLSARGYRTLRATEEAILGVPVEYWFRETTTGAESDRKTIRLRNCQSRVIGLLAWGWQIRNVDNAETVFHARILRDGWALEFRMSEEMLRRLSPSSGRSRKPGSCSYHFALDRVTVDHAKSIKVTATRYVP